MVRVRSERQHALTPPKHSEPLTATLPDGASPETCTIRGPAGSLLVTVIVAALNPNDCGSKRIGTDRESPATIESGYDNTSGVRNSPEEAVISVTERVHLPLLL